MDIITPILSVASILCSFSRNNMCCYLLDLQENKDALSTAMDELKDARDDVKRRVDEAETNPNELRKRTYEVDGWLQRVQTIEDQVGKILGKIDQEIEGRCLRAKCPKICWRAQNICMKAMEKLPIVNDLKSKGSFVDVTYKLRPPSVLEEPTIPTVGMESLFKKVLKLMDEEDEVRVMGLYGQGGVGKTTLLKQINNEFLKSTTNITRVFDVVILVVVSKEINIDKIQKEIANRLGLFRPNIDHFNIRNALTKMNFLLLVDDLWERVDLQYIGVPRPENNKSKIIFTTRLENVCGDMDADITIRMKCLHWNEAWTLFQEKVGNKSLNSHPKVPELAEAVARECGGLPLALITIGRAMSTKKTVREWNHAITTLQEYAAEFPGMGDKILPLLKLSYDSLRTDMIKSCFLYCALFPEDHFIDIAKLIDYWIGEGFISLNEFEHIDKARNYGYDVIGDLKGACLLESGGDEETEVKMHDTIRDLALWIACECGSSKRNRMLIIGESNSSSERLWCNAERVLLSRLNRGEMKVYLPPPKSPNLLTLIYDLPSVRFTLPCSFFQFMPLLRVLDLSHSYIETFPISITELLELQHLSLSWTFIDVIPGELRKLVKLKYLDLSHMHDLKEISNGVISSLFELRVLYLQGSSGGVMKLPGVVWDIEEVYKLKHLNDLRITIKTEATLNNLLSLNYQNLQMCTTYLHLQVYYTVFSLSSLSSSTWVLGEDNIKSLGKLELLSNLETLLIQSLPMNMEWENHLEAQQHLRSFQNLSQITIIGCHALKDLTWVVYVENLRRLDVETCEQIEEIIVGEKISNMMNSDIFKSLKILKISYLPKLKSICSDALVFPSLVSMYVFECPKLKKLPLDSRSNVNNTLQVIEGQRKWWSELEWEDHDNDNVKSKFLSYIEHRQFKD